MPYIKTTIKAGKTIEIHKGYTTRYHEKSISPAPKRKPTPEQMEKVNQKNAEQSLRLLINNNFGYMDHRLILTYTRENRPDPEGAKKQLDKFLRDCRKEYRKQGLEFKWVAVTEYENKAIHHHLVVNGIDSRILTRLWSYGRMHIASLDDTGDYIQLAEYLVKETSKTFRNPNATQKKRWRCSRNLKRPESKKEIIHSRAWTKDPKPLKGYYIVPDSVVNGINPVTGYPYQSYRMVQLPDQNKRRKSDGKQPISREQSKNINRKSKTVQRSE